MDRLQLFYGRPRIFSNNPFPPSQAHLPVPIELNFYRTASDDAVTAGMDGLAVDEANNPIMVIPALLSPPSSLLSTMYIRRCVMDNLVLFFPPPVLSAINADRGMAGRMFYYRIPSINPRWVVLHHSAFFFLLLRIDICCPTIFVLFSHPLPRLKTNFSANLSRQNAVGFVCVRVCVC